MVSNTSFRVSMWFTQFLIDHMLRSLYIFQSSVPWCVNLQSVRFYFGTSTLLSFWRFQHIRRWQHHIFTRLSKLHFITFNYDLRPNNQYIDFILNLSLLPWSAHVQKQDRIFQTTLISLIKAVSVCKMTYHALVSLFRFPASEYQLHLKNFPRSRNIFNSQGCFEITSIVL